MAQTETARCGPMPSRNGVAPGQARVLLVDDDQRFLHVLAGAIEPRLDGAYVETCSSPVAALESIEAGDYDVVVSDLLMDGLSGLDLLQRVKAVRPSSLVVLITGADDRDLSVRALRGGAYDFIQKPVDADYLAACVNRAIETRRLRAEVERQQAALRQHADELEQTVAERTEELRHANRSKDEFLATISHELRTPLTSILGWAQLLAGGQLDASERAQAIESIARNARSQAQLIDDLLDVSRIITGKLRLDVQEVDIGAVLDGALGVVLPAAEAKGITLEVRREDAQGPLPGDPSRLQQVFWNLLVNAVKFTQNGGRVSVLVSRRGPAMRIAVHDNGAGIERDVLPFVFDRFWQGESRPTSRRGLGLGLAIVRHLVELHGGTVMAKSPGAGLGATFTVTLPCPERAVVDPAPRGRRWPSQARVGEARDACLRAVRVLIVDDEADTRQVLRLVLEQAGAVVVTASSADEAREAFRRVRPDVLLCDIGLGTEDGYALLGALRELPHEGGRALHAIALTGYAKPEDRARALSAGFELHLAKPGPADLPVVIAELLERGEPS
jgi:signal transduction histidine kinase